LKKFLKRHTYHANPTQNNDSFLLIEEDKLMENFMLSLEPYYKSSEQIDEDFSDIKREELLLILLKKNLFWQIFSSILLFLKKLI
jgi:hypothetical protein